MDKHDRSPALYPLLIILLVSFLIRIYHLGAKSIWFDEGFTIKYSHQSIVEILTTLTQGEIHPPLFFFISHYWVSLFGDSEFSIRFPAMIFGVLSVFMVFKVADLLFGKKVGVISSLLLGLSTFHVWYSQEARSYSLMVLLALISFYFFLKLFKEKSFKVSSSYVLFSGLLLYTHSFGLFAIIAQNLFFLSLFFSSREVFRFSLRRWIILQSALVLFYSPWIWTLVNQTLRLKGENWIPDPSILSIMDTFYAYSGWSYLLMALFIALSLIPALLVKDKQNSNLKTTGMDSSVYSASNHSDLPLSNDEKYLLLFLWLFIPIILPYIISKIVTPIYWIRYTIEASIAFYLLVAKGISDIGYGRGRNFKYLEAALIITIVILSLTAFPDYYRQEGEEPWRRVANLIDEQAMPGDLVLFNNGVCKEVCFDYYSKRSDLVKVGFPKDTRHVREEHLQELLSNLKGHNRVWVIFSNGDDPTNLILRVMYGSYKHVYRTGGPGLLMVRFER